MFHYHRQRFGRLTSPGDRPARDRWPVTDRSAGTDTRPSLMCGRPERALAALWNRPTPPT